MAKKSKQRDIVLKALQDNVVHPTVDELYQIIKQSYSNIGSATVYRNLNSLAEEGIIRKINGLENSAHFDHITRNHYHFICDKCHKIYDISSEVAPNVNDLAKKETGFEVLGHDICFNGICKKCLEKER